MKHIKLTRDQENFAFDHKININEIKRFIHLSRTYKRQSEHAMNGATISRNTQFPFDKSLNAKLWDEQANNTAEEMSKLVKSWGFHHLDFDVGLWPTIQTTDRTIHFPY